jgi:sugar O-acyltransferase (sialic acid O-acetyltransferase NeuD family)
LPEAGNNLRILIIGAGGHGQVVADILLTAAQEGSAVRPVAYVDRDERLWNTSLLELPVVGAVADCARVHHDALIVAVGDNLTRGRLFDRLASHGERFAIARHPRAIVSATSTIRPGSVIAAGVVVNTGARVGANVILNTGCIVEHHNEIGNHVHVAPGARLGGNVIVEEGALVGIGATVLPGCRIGAWSVVGAGAVVTEHVPPGVVVVGVPARVNSRVKRRRRSPSGVRSVSFH